MITVHTTTTRGLEHAMFPCKQINLKSEIASISQLKNTDSTKSKQLNIETTKHWYVARLQIHIISYSKSNTTPKHRGSKPNLALCETNQDEISGMMHAYRIAVCRKVTGNIMPPELPPRQTWQARRLTGQHTRVALRMHARTNKVHNQPCSANACAPDTWRSNSDA